MKTSIPSHTEITASISSHLSDSTTPQPAALSWIGTTPRPNQHPPQNPHWQVWLILAGRGFGKTRTGAETITSWVHQGISQRIALVGATESDVRDVMIQGHSGIISIAAQTHRPTYEPSKRRLVWATGAIATMYSADRYEQLRGPQFDTAWIDELCKFRYPHQTWDQLMMGMRLGPLPRVIVTTTPKPIPLIKDFLKAPWCHVTRGSTFDNAQNLPAVFLNQMRQQYENTRLGAQELYAEILDDIAGALWKREMIQYLRAPPDLIRIVVAIDPAVSAHEDSAETGIIVAGIDAQGQGYVLDDCSGRLSAHEWAKRAVDAYHQHGGDRIVAEVNNGGDLVQSMLQAIQANLSYHPVRATRGKTLRAEPIVALYEQKRIFHHCRFKTLEDQLCEYIPQTGRPSDRMDALVWAFTDLFFQDNGAFSGFY